MPIVQDLPDKAFMKDLYLFNRGEAHHAYRTFGAHSALENRRRGIRFTVWAPNAREVRVAGDFNGWDGSSHPMEPAGGTGCWSLFIPGLKAGTMYKYEIMTADGRRLMKADPFAFASELRPGTASVVADLGSYKWKDEDWQARKLSSSPYEEPMLTYEIHMGTWKIKGKEIFYSYDEIGGELLDYVVKMGYTHIELMPLAEHPFDKSWGYQITGYFAPTSRYGSPKSLMKFIDRCHRKGIGVILDWVPAHFCKDEQGLRQFDGTPIYEGADPKLAEKPLWGTNAFDYGRTEVRSFLISNAIYWMDVFHVDGLRVDAVASMTDLTMDKPPEMHSLNRYGGTRNLEAAEFLQNLNKTVFRYFPNALMIAEDSSSEPGVTAPVHEGGLGFNFKWNMGWMNDMLRYMQLEPSERPKRHNLLTFAIMYAYTENFVLPLSHDEVVHGKRSLLNKMPGSYGEKFDGLRLFYGFWMTHPGKKLLFMGGEFGQFDEWKDSESLDWMVLEYDSHQQMQHYSRKLNHLYRKLSSLWQKDCDPEGFEWIDADNASQSVVSFIRRGEGGKFTVAIANFSRNNYGEFLVGVPEKGRYSLLLHSGDSIYGGSLAGLPTHYLSKPEPMHGRDYSLTVELPPLSFQLLEFRPREHIDEEMGTMGHKEMIAMLLAGGEGKRLGVLTKDLAKPAVHFGGKYRIIDFTLSNCMHSGIDTVGVLTQYQPLELNRYLGIGSPWGLDRSDGGMAVLPPYVKSKGGDWYKGTANAIYQNMGFIDRYEPEYVLVISGDHIYKMDYEKMLEHHKELGADVTIAGLEVELKEASRFGTMHIGENCRVTDFEEKPKHPVSNVVSMGVYIFSWKVLQKYLILDEGDRKSSHDFGKDIIPRMLEDDIRLHMYPFKGYWKDVGTIDSLWEAHMDLLGAEPQLDLGGDEWRIYSARHNRPAHYVSPEASISDSLVTEGCVVEGVVERSVLFHGVEVGAGSFIRESVIMPGAIVGEGVKLYRAIVGEGAVIEPGVVMGSPDSPDIAVVGSDEKISRSPKMQEVEQP